MSNGPIFHTMVPSHGLRCSQSPSISLAALLAHSYGCARQTTRFSTSAPLLKRRRVQIRDSNPDRGVSALRRTGLRHPVSMSKMPLPEPVLDSARRSKPTVSDTHGLWGFFNEQRSTLSIPGEDRAHGMKKVSLCDSVATDNADFRSAMGS